MNGDQPEHRVLDEQFDAWISRPISTRLAQRFYKWGMSADQVTAVAVVLGVSAGICLAGTGLWPILGGILLIGMVIVDCADGAVARMYPPSDRPWRGRMLDGVADLATILAVHVGMVIHLANTGLNVGGYELSTLEIALIAVVAFASFSWKSSCLDDIKQRLKPDTVDTQLHLYVNQKKTLFEKFLFWLLATYVKSAEKAAGPGRPGGYDLFKQVAVVGPSHHLVAIGLAGILIPFSATAFLTYFVLTIVPGNIYLYLVTARARREQALEVGRPS